MSVQVTMQVFSGRRNPSWALTEEQEHQLLGRLDELAERTLTKPSGVLGRLGYRGFSLRRVEDAPGGALSLLVHEGIVDCGQFEENRVVGSRDLEKWVLDTEPGIIEDDVRRLVEAELEGKTETAPVTFGDYHAMRVAKATCPVCAAKDAPAYQPGLWNVPSVQPYNNCYNYANNQATNTFAQPGRAHHAQATTMACPDVNTAAKADGLTDSPNFSAPLGPGQGWYVALVIWPGRDFHWYRQDNVGCWSHKPGSTAVRDVDNSGNRIRDPQTCDRGPYTDFCTFMVTNSQVVIR